ncbi:MAG: hypothetical protein HBSAPP04_08800 [Ignavibacteriaceae bacterium]|nr:MAG: hypothetical protein HBSAPP04_08800 [Ignavibacteriaceae bacterium]
MICWVLYDIKNDRTRGKIAKACLQSGLNRVQYSCFVGNLDENEMDELQVRIEDLYNEDEDSVYIFPMSRKDFNQTVLLGQAFDKKYVSGDLKNMLL